MKFDKVVKLKISSDLCLASYEAALRLVDTPYYILGGKDQLQDDIVKYIADRNEVGFQLIPSEMLRTDYDWCLVGRKDKESICVLGWYV